MDLRILAAFIKRSILAEQAEEKAALRKFFLHPSKKSGGIFPAVREYHMPDEHSFGHHTFLIKLRFSCLGDHSGYCLGSCLEIVFSIGIPG